MCTGVPIVTICDYKLIQETIVKDGEAYVDRFQFGDFTEQFYGIELISYFCTYRFRR
jgi:hypothetical protein